MSSTKSPKDVFENIAAVYAETVDSKPIHVYYERPNLWSLLPNNLAGLQVLDIGCGSGWYAEKLVEAQTQVTALDASPTMVELTKQRLKGKGKVYLADLEQPLSFLQDNNFDLIVASLIIHYVKNWLPLFAELARVIKRQGILVFSTHQPHMEATLFKLKNYYQKILITDHWKDVGEVKYYHHTLHELSEGLYQAGFLIERLLEPAPLPEMQKYDSIMYKNITAHPWLLFVKAIKI